LELSSIAVTLRDRPYAAPQTGPFELGFKVIGPGGFSASMSANAILFISSAGETAFVPVIAEMRNPKDFRKALYSCMGFVGAAYFALSLVGKFFILSPRPDVVP
jgi:amino acid transporter